MRISDWSSDVCSSDLFCQRALREFGFIAGSIGDESVIDDPREAWVEVAADLWRSANTGGEEGARHLRTLWKTPDELAGDLRDICDPARELLPAADRSEEHTSELQSLMRISYAVFCLKKKKIKSKIRPT